MKPGVLVCRATTLPIRSTRTKRSLFAISETSRDASWIVTGSGLVMIARVMGRSASSATSLVSIVSRS